MSLGLVESRPEGALQLQLALCDSASWPESLAAAVPVTFSKNAENEHWKGFQECSCNELSLLHGLEGVHEYFVWNILC